MNTQNKIFIILLILLVLITPVNALTDSESKDIKNKLFYAINDKEDFKNLLEELDTKTVDITSEKYIKDLIIIKADVFNINLKDYQNINGLFVGEELNINKEEYPNINFEKSTTSKQIINIISYIIILAIIIGLVTLVIKYKDKLQIKKKLTPQEETIKRQIGEARNKGYNDEQILTQFLQKGYKEKDIQKLM